MSTAQTYRNYVIIYICGIPGVLLGALMYGVPLIGRQWGMIISSALMGVSLFLFSAINTEASNVGINIMEYFFQSMFNALVNPPGLEDQSYADMFAASCMDGLPRRIRHQSVVLHAVWPAFGADCSALYRL